MIQKVEEFWLQKERCKQMSLRSRRPFASDRRLWLRHNRPSSKIEWRGLRGQSHINSTWENWWQVPPRLNFVEKSKVILAGEVLLCCCAWTLKRAQQSSNTKDGPTSFHFVTYDLTVEFSMLSSKAMMLKLHSTT